MKVFYTLNNNDYLAFISDTRAQSKIVKTSHRNIALLLALWLVVYNLTHASLIVNYEWNYHQWVFNWVDALDLLVAFALIMFLPRLMRWDYLQFIKRILRRGSNDFSGHRTLELLESSIRQSGPGRVEEVSYDRVEKIIKTNSYLYIYLGVLTAFVIPLTAFESDCDFEDFMAIIVDKTDQRPLWLRER